MYVNSAKIKMFPSAWRAEGINPEATLNTEENLTSLSRRLANEKHLKSYVVSRDATYDTMTFVINGYIFDLADVSSLGRPLYAGIKLKNDDGGIADFSNKTLINLVENDIATLDRVESEGATPQFCGVEFSNTELSGYEADCVIQLLDSSNQVPPTSWLNTSSAQVYNSHGSGQGSDEPKPINREMSTDILYTQAISAYSSAVVSIYGSFIDVLGAMAVKGHITPSATNTYNLGSDTKRFKNIYGKSIYASTLEGDDISLTGGVTAYWYGLLGANGSNPVFDFYQASTKSTYMRFDASCSSLYINFNNSYVSIYASKNFAIVAPSGTIYEKAGYVDLYAVKSGAYNGYLSLRADNGIYAWAYSGDVYLGYGHSSNNGVHIGAYSSYTTRLRHNPYASTYNVNTTLPSRSGTLANLTGAYCASNSSTIYYPNQDDVYGAHYLYDVRAVASSGVWYASNILLTKGNPSVPVYVAGGVPVACPTFFATSNVTVKNNLTMGVDDYFFYYKDGGTASYPSDWSMDIYAVRTGPDIRYNLYLKTPNTRWNNRVVVIHLDSILNKIGGPFYDPDYELQINVLPVLRYTDGTTQGTVQQLHYTDYYAFYFAGFDSTNYYEGIQFTMFGVAVGQ